MSCCNKEKTKFKFLYRKVCYGPGFGVGIIANGEIKGMETCDHKDYEGWFLEIGGSAGALSAGIDLSFKNSTYTLPLTSTPLPNILKVGKVKEAGVGLGSGWNAKAMFCWYIYLDSEPPVPCGCDNVPAKK